MLIDFLNLECLDFDRKNIPRGTRDIRIIDQVIEGKKNIVRRKWMPVVPQDIFAQIERPGQAVFADLPALR